MADLTKAEIALLSAVRDDQDVIRIIREYDIGYGWAIQAGLIRKVGPENTLDFHITPAGRAALEPRDER